MGWIAFQKDNRFGPRKGLEGPFHFANGRVLYYDAKAGEYYDSTTDFYVPREEIDELNEQLVQMMST